MSFNVYLLLFLPKNPSYKRKAGTARTSYYRPLTIPFNPEREKKDENIKVEKPKKEKVNKVVQKKANKTVRVVALTKS